MHSNMTAVLARKIASEFGYNVTEQDDAFLAGILHDVGILLLAGSYPDRYEQVLDTAAKTGKVLAEIEYAEFNKSHTEVGGYLMGLWGLPDPVVEAVFYHHNPMDAPAIGRDTILAVHLANALLHEQIHRNVQHPVSELNMKYLEELGLINNLPELRKLTLRMLEEHNHDQ